ncbi:MAG: stage 0 sporulation family protein [Rubrobacteridae bacterium]|nr:stage 0 sporulation family protein [Rubrobacteridae bacterium]
MPIVVGIVFKRAGKVYYFDPDEMEFSQGEKVVVKTSRGMEFGEVVVAPIEVPQEEITAPLKKVVRKASSEDCEQLAKNKQKEKDAHRTADEKILKHRLPMKLIEVEYVFDGSKIIFYFTADGRVDFRDLVKDLASVFKTRIELRQIGVRDEAKMVGGLGPCGQRLCCTVFLGDFEPVSIKMAKEQDLPLNPLKISGVCGRLMCCLKYEYDAYVDFKKRAPRRGTQVNTESGIARIVEFNVPKEMIIAELESGQRIEMPLQTALQCACKSKCCENKNINGEETHLELEDESDVELLKELEDTEQSDSGNNRRKRKPSNRPKRNYVIADEIIDENEGFIDTSLTEKFDKPATKSEPSEPRKGTSDVEPSTDEVAGNGSNISPESGEIVSNEIAEAPKNNTHNHDENGGKGGGKNGGHHKKGKHGKHGKPFKPHKNKQNDNGNKG